VIACLVALGVAALLSLDPWAEQSVTPRLNVAPEPGVSLGDAVAVPPGRRLAVAEGRPAGAPAGSFAAERRAEEGAAQPRPGVAPAHAVASRPVSPAAGTPGETSPAPAAAPEPSPAPVAVPVAAPSPPPEPAAPSPTRAPTGPAGAGHGPIGAGAGPGEAPESAIEVEDGGEYALAFDFLLQPAAYRAPGDENLIVRFSGESGVPTFGLQLWDDDEGRRGLWSSGEAMGGERFLTPLGEGVWHQAVVSFQASSEGEGFYVLLLDDRPVDVRAGVSLLDPGSDSAEVETGLFRDGERVVDSPDVLFGPARLGETLESVIP
jgi:hypothetical protein